MLQVLDLILTIRKSHLEPLLLASHFPFKDFCVCLELGRQVLVVGLGQLKGRLKLLHSYRLHLQLGLQSGYLLELSP
jgi:hypothetical protein